MTTAHTIDAGVLNSLGTKLDALELTAPERVALDAVLTRAASAGGDDEVEGFGVVFEVEVTFKGTDEELAALSDPGRRMGNALGFHIHVNPYIGETEKNLR